MQSDEDAKETINARLLVKWLPHIHRAEYVLRKDTRLENEYVHDFVNCLVCQMPKEYGIPPACDGNYWFCASCALIDDKEALSIDLSPISHLLYTPMNKRSAKLFLEGEPVKPTFQEGKTT
jgi:hypothetical protein